jgi:hypothetical protein
MTEDWEEVNEANDMLSKTAALELNRQQNAESTVYADATARIQAGRKRFVTKGGKMGLGLEKMQSGDRIVPIKGARMSYVIREYEAGKERLLDLLLVNVIYTP